MSEIERIKNVLIKMDLKTYNHSCRVYRLAKEYEKYTDTSSDMLSTAAFLHDIGKIYISSNILEKPFALTRLERELIDLHSYIGYKILIEKGVVPEIANIVYIHHGLNIDKIVHEKEILVNRAKELHTLDAFDAMITDRPYRHKMDAKIAQEFIERDSFISSEALEFLKSIDFESVFETKININEIATKITSNYIKKGEILYGEFDFEQRKTCKTN